MSSKYLTNIVTYYYINMNLYKYTVIYLFHLFYNISFYQIWLNKDLPTDEVIDKLNNMTLQEETLSWHPVSTIVNNVFHKTPDCRKETKLK